METGNRESPGTTLAKTSTLITYEKLQFCVVMESQHLEDGFPHIFNSNSINKPGHPLSFLALVFIIVQTSFCQIDDLFFGQVFSHQVSYSWMSCGTPPPTMNVQPSFFPNRPISRTKLSAQQKGQPETPIFTLAGRSIPEQNSSISMPSPKES